MSLLPTFEILYLSNYLVQLSGHRITVTSPDIYLDVHLKLLSSILGNYVLSSQKKHEWTGWIIAQLNSLSILLGLQFVGCVCLKNDKQDQQEKAAFNERNPHMTQPQEPVARSNEEDEAIRNLLIILS
jgi:hypothetical protein